VNKGERTMLGLDGIAVPLGFILTVLSTLLCVIYGLINWNKGYITEEEMQKEQVWKEEDAKVKDSL
jgi:Na+-transporting methylmalonyl-CoA/oxaloacetate decarboxylase gamma subunit